jgi:molybdate transport system substrate-binding protein
MIHLHAAVAASLFLAAATPGQAAEISVASSPGMKEVLDDLGPKFATLSRHNVSVQYLIPDPLRSRMERGEHFDVLIVSAELLNALSHEKKIIANSATALGRVGIGVSIKAGAPKPDISTVAAFKQTMLNAKSISYTNGTAAGAHIASIMQRLGIAEEMKSKTKLMGGGGQNPKAVAAGDVELGISVIPDIQPVRGAELLGPLPAELQKYIDWYGAVTVASAQEQLARAYLRFLTTADAAPIFREKWIEPLLGR